MGGLFTIAFLLQRVYVCCCCWCRSAHGERKPDLWTLSSVSRLWPFPEHMKQNNGAVDYNIPAQREKRGGKE